MEQLVRLYCHTQPYGISTFVSKQPFPNNTHLKTFIADDRFDVTVTNIPRETKLLGLGRRRKEERARNGCGEGGGQRGKG